MSLLKGAIPIDDEGGLREALLAYCFQDTIAMVRLLEKLRALAASNFQTNESETLPVVQERRRGDSGFGTEQLNQNEGEDYGSNQQ